MPMTWDNAADAKLFAAVVATGEPRFDYAKLAAIMGPECTAKAVTHRISKLREIAKTFDTSAVLAQTPVKRVRTSKAKAKAAERIGDDDDNDDESPTKKQKTTTKPKKTATTTKKKAEPEFEEEAEGDEASLRSDENSSDG